MHKHYAICSPWCKIQFWSRLYKRQIEEAKLLDPISSQEQKLQFSTAVFKNTEKEVIWGSRYTPLHNAIPFILLFLAVTCFAYRQQPLVSRNLEISPTISQTYTNAAVIKQKPSRSKAPEMERSLGKGGRCTVGS